MRTHHHSIAVIALGAVTLSTACTQQVEGPEDGDPGISEDALTPYHDAPSEPGDLGHEPSGGYPGTCAPTTAPTHPPTWDSRWSDGLSLDIDNTILGVNVGIYRIRWFNGSWSKWYTPGVDDIDWKTNYDGTQRRVWSYFEDHHHQRYIDSGVRAPTWDSRWTQGLSGNTDNVMLGKDIAMYRIRWFNGNWSKWYTPCVDDVDWKTNGDGTQRRVWSYFKDHQHQFYTYW